MRPPDDVNLPATSPTAPTTVPAAALGFVERSGGQLVADGGPWRFVGYNLPCANPFVMQEGEFDHYLDVVKADSGANAVRMWFFQTNGGPGNWEPFDRALGAIRRSGLRIVATLTDQWNGGCDGGSGAEKTIDWYQGGYRSPDAGHSLSYRDFAVEVAQRYADNPDIAMWQLVNEAQANTVDPSGQVRCDNEAGKRALRAFADDVTGAIKAVDANHLVNLGTIGGNQCGMAGSEAFKYVHDGAVDLCEYHDYGAAAASMPGGADQLAQRLRDCAGLAHGAKPIFVGEAGIQGNVKSDGGPASCDPWPTCSPDPITPESLTQRATFFRAKIRAALDAGASGYLLWVKSPFYSAGSDRYAIGDGDPTEAALKDALAAVKG